MKFSLSPAQAALLHVAESGASSALLTLLVGIFQNLSTGKISLPELGSIFGGGFLACMGLVYKSVKSSPALKQAEVDTATQIKQYIEPRFGGLETRLTLLVNRLSASPVAAPASPAQQPPVETYPTSPYVPAVQQFYAPRPPATTATYAPAVGQSQIAWQPPVLPPSSSAGG